MLSTRGFFSCFLWQHELRNRVVRKINMTSAAGAVVAHGGEREREREKNCRRHSGEGENFARRAATRIKRSQEASLLF